MYNKLHVRSCPEGIQPCNMKNKDIYWRRYQKHCTWTTDLSVPVKAGTLGPHPVSQSPSATPLYFLESHWQCEISSFKGDFSLGKSQKLQSAKSGLSHRGDVMFRQKFLHKTQCMSECVVMMKLPITSCPQLWPSESSVEECSSLTQNLMQIRCSTEQSFWMRQPHSTHAHSTVSTTPTD